MVECTGIGQEKEFAMKKTYQIEVDCANCANLMEEAGQENRGR